MKVKELIEELKELDPDKEIGILYSDDEDEKQFPSRVICIRETKLLSDCVKWSNKGYCMF